MENYYVLYIAIGVVIALAYIYSKRSLSNSTNGIRIPDRDFPYKWRTILENEIEFYQRLNREERKRFEYKTHVFLLNVRIVGIQINVTDQDRILIAASAIIPIFGFPKWHYAYLSEVHLHPDKFPIKGTDKMAHGLTGWGAMEGILKLSKKALYEGYADQNDQKNVAIHEFIHIIDKQDGEVDGIMQRVMNEVDISPWLGLIHQKMTEIETGNSSIRKYGAANRAEFLAVVGEFFFESPEKMKSEHPGLYSALDSIFNPKVKSNFKYTKKHDPCPCGSKRNFSRCCFKNAASY
ncbi:MAG: zinc-dependent peptidase [Crocinitomicaceae bacterium]